MTKVSPSLLSCDFSEIANEVKSMEQAGADMLHLDVMDGVFVNNISFGMPIVKAIREKTKLFLDTHLMIVEPEKYVDKFADVGADLITFHIEATDDADRVIDMIHNRGLMAGISLRPATPIESIYPFLGKCDLVLVMTVEPGHGGQKLIPETLEKVRKLKEKIQESNLSVSVQVDGGINEATGREAVLSGADVLVAGSYVFGASDRKKAIESLR